MERITSYIKSKGYTCIDVSSGLNTIELFKSRFIEKTTLKKYDKCFFVIDSRVVGDEVKDYLGDYDNSYIMAHKGSIQVIPFDMIHIIRLNFIDRLIEEDNCDCIICFQPLKISNSCPACNKRVCSDCCEKLVVNGKFKCPNCREMSFVVL